MKRGTQSDPDAAFAHLGRQENGCPVIWSMMDIVQQGDLCNSNKEFNNL